jgi:glycogen debranching enzyme
MEGLMQAAAHQPDMRLPELYCGFAKKGNNGGPIRYPVSCVPQAWAAGSMFHILNACLGMETDSANGTLLLHDPSLPEWLGPVSVTGLPVGKGRLDLEFSTTAGGKTKVKVLKKTGAVSVRVLR